MKSTCKLSGVLFLAVFLSLLVMPVKLAIADAQSKRIAIEYEPPKNPAHQPLYEMLKGRFECSKNCKKSSAHFSCRLS